MDIVKIKDKQFVLSISAAQIEQEVARIAAQMNKDLEGKNPLFISVLNGSFIFTADLMRKITIPCGVTFVKLASYEGISSTGVIKEVVGLSEDISDRTVVIIEDIVDTGLTMQRLIEMIGSRSPKEIKIATLLVKPSNMQVEVKLDYVAMEIPNDFIVGYGLDYDGYGRNLTGIYSIVK